MPHCSRLLSLGLGAILLSVSLGGCASINSRLASGMGDMIPHWAGGLPADAPGRPGTAAYDQEMKEREREAQQPKTADSSTAASKPDSTTSATH